MKFKSLNILAFDPGLSTGTAVFHKGKFAYANTVKGDNLDVYVEIFLGNDLVFDYVVVEEFRLRATKAKSLTNDPLYTPQLIGKIKEWFKNYKVVMQQPSVANGKRFYTVDKLKALGLKWGSVHERDAITHGLYALSFNKEILWLND